MTQWQQIWHFTKLIKKTSFLNSHHGNYLKSGVETLQECKLFVFCAEEELAQVAVLSKLSDHYSRVASETVAQQLGDSWMWLEHFKVFESKTNSVDDLLACEFVFADADECD